MSLSIVNLKRRRRVVRLCRQRDTMIFVGKSSFALPRSRGLFPSPSPRLVSSRGRGRRTRRLRGPKRCKPVDAPTDRDQSTDRKQKPRYVAPLCNHYSRERLVRPSPLSPSIQIIHKAEPAIPSSLPDCKRNNRFSPSFVRCDRCASLQASPLGGTLKQGVWAHEGERAKGPCTNDVSTQGGRGG